MNGTKLGHGGIHRGFHRGFVCHIGLGEGCIVPQLGRHFRAFLVVTIKNHDLATLGNNGFCSRLAQA